MIRYANWNKISLRLQFFAVIKNKNLHIEYNMTQDQNQNSSTDQQRRLEDTIRKAFNQSKIHQNGQNGRVFDVRNMTFRLVDVVMIIAILFSSFTTFLYNYYKVDTHITNFEPKVERLVKDYHDLEDHLTRVQITFNQFEKKLENHDVDIEEINFKIKTLKSEIDYLDGAIASNRRRILNLEKKLNMSKE